MCGFIGSGVGGDGEKGVEVELGRLKDLTI
jgi:hypothetical protein